jgi:hypothetical protein
VHFCILALCLQIVADDDHVTAHASGMHFMVIDFGQYCLPSNCVPVFENRNKIAPWIEIFYEVSE